MVFRRGASLHEQLLGAGSMRQSTKGAKPSNGPRFRAQHSVAHLAFSAAATAASSSERVTGLRQGLCSVGRRHALHLPQRAVSCNTGLPCSKGVKVCRQCVGFHMECRFFHAQQLACKHHTNQPANLCSCSPTLSCSHTAPTCGCSQLNLWAAMGAGSSVTTRPPQVPVGTLSSPRPRRRLASSTASAMLVSAAGQALR